MYNAGERGEGMKKAYLYAASAIVMWSTSPVVAKLLLSELDVYQILCVSMFCAFVAMFVINLCCKKWELMKRYSLRDYLTMSVISLPGVFMYYAFYYGGTARMPASQAFIVNYLWPIMSIVFACIILKEKLTPRKFLAVAMSFLGVFTVTGSDLLHFDRNTLIGTLCCFSAAVCYGLYTALNKKSGYDKQIATTVSKFSAFLPSLVIVLSRGQGLMIAPAQLPGLFLNGLGAIALPSMA
jgi:drug/metabolite transporter (DMT)-like permease